MKLSLPVMEFREPKNTYNQRRVDDMRLTSKDSNKNCEVHQTLASGEKRNSILTVTRCSIGRM